MSTLEAAKNKVRNIREPVVVYVRSGTYYLQKPVVFSPEDGRSPDEKVVYKAYNNEKVVISGAVPLKLTWTPYQKNIYQATVPAGIVFDQLFLNGKKQRMARYPNYDPASSHFGGYAEEVLSPEKIATWKNPEGAFIHALHSHERGGYHYRIMGKDADDFATLFFSGFMVTILARYSASGFVLARMTLNIIIDALLGSVPIIGDVFDVAFKANIRNVKLMRKHYVEDRHKGGAWKVVVPILLVLLAGSGWCPGVV